VETVLCYTFHIDLRDLVLVALGNFTDVSHSGTFVLFIVHSMWLL